MQIIKQYKGFLVDIREVNPSRLDIWIKRSGFKAMKRISLLGADADFALDVAHLWVESELEAQGVSEALALLEAA